MKPGINIFWRIAVACFMLMANAALYSQENSEEKILQVKAAELAFSNPDETIKIANHLLKKPQSDENITALNLLISRGYITKGDYNKSLDYVYEAGKISKNTNDSLRTEVLFLKAEVTRRLHLFKQSADYLKDIKLVTEEADPILSKSTGIRLQLEQSLSELDRLKYKAALQSLQSIQSDDIHLQKTIAYAKAMALYETEDYKSSENEFNKALKLYQSANKLNVVFETKANIGLSKVYYKYKQYQKAIDILSTALDKAVLLTNVPLQEEIYFQIAANYLALGKMAEYQENYDKFLSLNTTALNLENEGVNSVFNLVSEEQESDYLSDLTSFKVYTYSAVALLALIIIAGILLYISNKNRRRHLKEIIGYLEVTNNLLVKSYTPTDKKETVKKITISNETEQVILAKLRKFEASTKYTSNDMSLATLSAQLDVNTKYLSEIINKHYNDNFNMYINRLRINYIIEKLKNEPEYLNYKISYLADESGFSSHSSFATVFKSITGIAPTVFIDLIGKEVNQKKA